MRWFCSWRMSLRIWWSRRSSWRNRRCIRRSRSNRLRWSWPVWLMKNWVRLRTLKMHERIMRSFWSSGRSRSERMKKIKRGFRACSSIFRVRRRKILLSCKLRCEDWNLKRLICICRILRLSDRFWCRNQNRSKKMKRYERYKKKLSDSNKKFMKKTDSWNSIKKKLRNEIST